MKSAKQILINEKVKPPPQKQVSDVDASRVLLYLRSRFNPIRRLTPELLSVYLDRSKVGFLREIALVWDAVQERDYKILLASELRKGSVARFDYQVEHIDGLDEADKAMADKHKEALQYFYGNLRTTRAIDENEKGGVKMLVSQMMDAVGSKYSVHEIVWQPQADGNLTAEFRWTPLWFFENLTGKLRYLTREGETYGIDLDEGGWMITTGRGLMYASLIAYMFKTLPLRDWVTFSERNGMPAFIGKTPAAPGTQQYEAMLEAVRMLGTEFAAVMNMTDLIEKVDLGGADAEKTYQPLIEWMDRAIVALWRGGDLSTMSSGKGTQGHGSQRQDEEADTILDFDVEMIDETLHQYVSKYVIEYMFGDDRPLARYKTVVPPDQATAQDIAIDQFLVSSAPEGEGLSWEDTLKRYGRIPAAKGQPILIAPKQDEQLPANLGNTRSATRLGLLNDRRAVKGDDTTSLLLKAAHKQLTEEQAKALAPLRDRIEQALKAPDAQLANAIQVVLADLPTLLKQLNLAPPTARILETAYSAALLDGLTQPLPKK